MADIGQFGKRGKLGMAKPLLANIAAGKKLPGIGHATHMQAFQRPWCEVLADDQLGGASTDIDDQPPPLAIAQSMSGTQVNQAGLLTAGDNLDAMAKQGLDT